MTQEELNKALTKAVGEINISLYYILGSNDRPPYEEILDLLRQGADINTPMPEENTPSILSYLIQHKADPAFISQVLAYVPDLHQEDSRGISPIMEALITEPDPNRDCRHYINAFLTHDPLCLHHMDEEMNNILHKIAGNENMLELSWAETRWRKNVMHGGLFEDNQTSHIANSTLENIKTFILEPYPELLNINNHLEHPVHVAARTLNNKLLSLFLDRDYGEISCRNEKGDNALIIAARHENWSGLQQMLNKSPHLTDSTDEEENNLLHIMAKHHKDHDSPTFILFLMPPLKHMTLEANLEGLRPVHFTKPDSEMRRIFLDAETEARKQAQAKANPIAPAPRP